ncbi:endonuclease/exonuclease/phosphatase family protein [Brucella pseudogrignonensis]|uniref:Endonuclease/exonuclease/phosphatase (EEP) superfamily protein YafD n=1 Tax=Brucella pseudogrignonensis TaxID=419475 RepID=A0ABU1M5Z4_9HYPH|nr:endonuclease/exonuclease/phosphatase family protein [Brucella pseudogrignonensis]MDR6431452.1 endonuclease/exonuclease/phosphatase (EEP) superfamily protein YafD [Brucella pseudogrignonensis]
MSKRRETFAFVLLIIAILVSVPLVLGFLGSAHPSFDSFAHFRSHLAILMGLLALPILFTTMRREGAMILLFAILAFSTTLGAARNLLDGSSAAHANVPTSGVRYSLVQINLRYNNPEPKRVLQMIAQEKPDVIAYQEAGSDWAMWIDILKGTYPYHFECRISGSNMGVGILSRRPFSEGGAQTCLGDNRLAMTSIDFSGMPVNVASYHAVLPWPYGQAAIIDKLVPELQKLDGASVIAGDFNATPWSNAVHRTEKASSTKAMTSIGGSWMPQSLPVTLAPFVGLPIDQILVSADIVAPVAATRDEAGSDHLPVRLEFSVPMPVRPNTEEPETQSVMLQ